jgi:hypothetical protein
MARRSARIQSTPTAADTAPGEQRPVEPDPRPSRGRSGDAECRSQHQQLTLASRKHVEPQPGGGQIERRAELVHGRIVGAVW